MLLELRSSAFCSAGCHGFAGSLYLAGAIPEAVHLNLMVLHLAAGGGQQPSSIVFVSVCAACRPSA